MGMIGYRIDQILDRHFKPGPVLQSRYRVRELKADGKVWGYVGRARQQSFGLASDPAAWQRGEEWAQWGNAERERVLKSLG